MKEYRKGNIPLARRLRADMTFWERKLWYDFLKGYEPRFQRQKAIGRYIVDFYCANAGIVIELDGSEHYTPEQRTADTERTIELAKLKIKVIRITNWDVDSNFRSVCEYIDRVVRENRRVKRK